MKRINNLFVMALLTFSILSAKADLPKNFVSTPWNAPLGMQFMGGNNLQTVFINNGIINYDKYTFTTGMAGTVWPFQSSTMKTIDFASGLWIGSKVILPGGIRELRTAVCMYNSVFTPGNIPVIGQVPPQSVCDDASWKVYLVNLVDSSLVNGGTRTRVAGGHTYTVTYDSWANWPIDKGAPYVEINNIPGYQPGWNADRPGIGIGNVRPSEISYTVYMDYTNCTDSIHLAEISLPGGTKPMGAEIQQLAYTFNCPGYINSYFVRWKIINKSANIWDSTYIGLANDADVGNAGDDAAGCDSTKDIAFTYNATNNDQVYGTSPPAIGTRLVQGPLLYTGNSNDTVRLPYRTYVGYKMQHLTSMNIFENTANPCLGDPDNAVSGYNLLRGFNGCGFPLVNYVTGLPTKFRYNGNACTRTGWIDSIYTDRRTIQSTGPVTVNPGDTQVIVMTFDIARGSSNFQSVCELLNNTDMLTNAYYTGLASSIIGITPVSSNVPLRYNLYQNYPNPFNPVTKIKFDIAGTGGGNVRLTIFDALGREVSTLVNEKLKPSTYETDWDGSNFTSGIYFVQLNAGSFSQTNKMVLIK